MHITTLPHDRHGRSRPSGPTTGLVAVLILVALVTPAASQRRSRGTAPSPPAGSVRVDDGQMASATIARMPSSRSNHACVAWHDRVYLVGGRSHDRTSAAAWVFDPYTRRFDELPSMARARMGHGAAISGRRLLVLGGTDEQSTVLDSIEAFDLDRGTWAPAGTMPAPRTRFGLACAGGRMWLAGGSDGHHPLAELHAFDPVKGTWERKADMPEPRERLALVALHGDLYAIGGNGPDDRGSRAVWRYSPATNTWSPFAKLEVARRNTTAVRLGDTIVVAGGWDHVEDEKIFPPQIEVYEARQNRWVSHGHLETPRDGCRAVAWRGRMLLFGGYHRDIVPYAEEIQWCSKARTWRPDPALRTVLVARPSAPVEGADQELEALPTGPEGLATLPGAEAARLGLSLPADPPGGAWRFQPYHYPRHLSAEASARHAAAPFLSGLGSGTDLFALMAGREGPVVETATPSSTSPPSYRLPTANAGGAAPTAQQILDRDVVSTLLYVGPAPGRREKPRGDDRGAPDEGRRAPDAKAVIASVVGLHKSTLELLARAYRPLPNPDPKQACFLDDSEMDQLGDGPVYTLVRIPAEVAIPTEAREDRLAPGPGPARVLASLLLTREDHRMGAPEDLADPGRLKGEPALRTTLRVAGAMR